MLQQNENSTEESSTTVFNNGEGCPSLIAGQVRPAVTIHQRTSAVVEGLDLVLRHHDVAEPIRAEMKDQIHLFCDTTYDETVWLKRIKYVLTYPLSKYLRNPLPPKPDKVFEPSGKLRRWMKARFNAFNRKNTHLWYSWLQCKRSSLPASDDIVEQAYDKHFETLTKRDPGDPKLIEDIMSMPIFVNLLNLLQSEVAKKMKNADFLSQFPSNSASFESSRGSGGQAGWLQWLTVDFDNDFGDATDMFPSFTISPYELWSMHYVKLFDKKGRSYFNVVERRCISGWERWESLRNHSFDEFKIRQFAQDELQCRVPVSCTIQGILEPMKIRVISKGESVPYYSCRPLQKAIHSSMRDLDPFRLIGRPFSCTDVMDLAELAAPTDRWFSIDYSAATDGLSWRYSGEIFKWIIALLPEEQRLIAEDVLAPHALHYPIRDSPGCRYFRGYQTNGQLMGSILSFPILCLANLGVYLKVTENVQRGWTDAQRLRHVLVNGDDMLYASSPDLWDVHVDIAGRVGLEMSVGKAYMHETYANINSTSVHYSIPDLWDGERRRTDRTPWRIDFLNVGLFYGRHKVQGETDGKVHHYSKLDDEADRCESVWGHSPLASEKTLHLLSELEFGIDEEKENILSPLNTILEGCLPGKQSEVLRLFISQHKREIKKETLAVYLGRGRPRVFTRNIFLPIALGGMGVLPPKDFKYKVKPVQVDVAENRIFERSHYGGYLMARQLPLPGHEVQDFDPNVAVPWQRPQDKRTLFNVVSRRSAKSYKQLMSHGAIPYRTVVSEIERPLKQSLDVNLDRYLEDLSILSVTTQCCRWSCTHIGLERCFLRNCVNLD
jgi:hypothetical protein